MAGHKASGFDNYLVLNSLPSSSNCMKTIRTSKGLIKLGFNAVSVIENDIVNPKHMKFFRSKCHSWVVKKHTKRKKNSTQFIEK